MRVRVFRLAVGAAVCVGAAGALLLSTDVGQVARWDVSAFLGLRGLGDHPLISWVAWRVVDAANLLPTLVILAAICAAGIAWSRPRHAGAAVLLVGGAVITSWALKIAFAHPRYQDLLGTQQLATDAFPSGHATTAMSVALAAVVVTPRRWRLLVAIPAACYALATELSLVIIGVHYPSDVLGALLVSGAFGLLAVAVLPPSDREPALRQRLAWPVMRPAGGWEGPLAVLAGGAAVVAFAVTVSHAGELVSYAAVNPSAVVAAAGIALASAALVYGIAAEANDL